MIALDRATLDPSSVRDPVQAPLATSAQIDMVLKQRAQKLPPHRLELSLQLSMLQPGRVLPAQPPNDLLKPLARAAERILAAAARAIPCSSISSTLRLQDFISRRVKFAAIEEDVDPRSRLCRASLERAAAEMSGDAIARVTDAHSAVLWR